MKMKKYFILITSIVFTLTYFTSCKKNKNDVVIPEVIKQTSKPASSYESDFAINWLNLHFLLIKSTPGFTPPVAARSLGYTSLALYESLVYGMPGYKSLAGQLNDLSSLPAPDSTKEYNWALITSTSQYTLLKELFLSTSDKNQLAIDSVRKLYETKFKVGTSDEVVERSIRFGATIASAINEYAKTDGGVNGNTSNFPSNYFIPSGIGFWKPTGTQLIPLLPFWGKNRTMVKANSNQIIPAPLTFSFEKNSDFFQQAKSVYELSKVLTTEQKAIASFFADGTGSITPPGHHFNVAKILLVTDKAKLDKVAEVFVKIGITLNDAFISCWKAKYNYFLMRPSTYITQTIDKSWQPFLSNPPFPDYASGHSTSAGATVEILESFYGKSVNFEDNTNSPNLPNRKFKSLEDYGQETSNSRVYGGIHYDFSCKKGYESGKIIGKNILALNFKK